jgi:hypothetical protein
LRAAPFTLSDDVLDLVSAGYVELEVNANAAARGPKATARFSTDVEQTISEAQADNHIYTTTTGKADAFAKGKKVKTEVGYFVKTDEEILSFEVAHQIKSSKKNKRKKKAGKNRKDKKNKSSNRKKKNRKDGKSNKGSAKKKKSKGKSKKPIVRERQQLTVTIVTRKSAQQNGPVSVD